MQQRIQTDRTLFYFNLFNYFILMYWEENERRLSVTTVIMTKVLLTVDWLESKLYDNKTKALHVGENTVKQLTFILLNSFTAIYTLLFLFYLQWTFFYRKLARSISSQSKKSRKSSINSVKKRSVDFSPTSFTNHAFVGDDALSLDTKPVECKCCVYFNHCQVKEKK